MKRASAFMSLALSAALVFLTPFPAFPQTEAARAAIEQAFKGAQEAAIPGPYELALGERASMTLDGRFVFIPKEQGAALLKAMGNGVSSSFLGLLVPQEENASWMITLEHTAEGYVKDEEAKHWDAGALLANLREGVKAQNKRRAELGMPGLEVTGWAEPPHYDEAKRHLVWAARAVDVGAPADEPASINYNTYALGRDGYFEFNLITGEDTLAADKPYAHEALRLLTWKPGHRYEDFEPGKDRTAEYGIMALVGGAVAAKKLGLLAVVGAFLAKSAKLLIIGGAAAATGLAKLFKRRG